MICDIVILYILKKRHIYKKKKYLYVEGDDPYLAAHTQVRLTYSLFHLLSCETWLQPRCACGGNETILLWTFYDQHLIAS